MSCMMNSSLDTDRGNKIYKMPFLISCFLDPPVENKGSKRKLSDICLDSAKRHRGANYQEKRLSYVTDKVDPVGVLESADNKLNRSPKARILRDFKLVGQNSHNVFFYKKYLVLLVMSIRSR